MEIEKKYLLKSPDQIPGPADRESRIEQYYLEPAKCRLEKQSGAFLFKAAGHLPIPLEGDKAALIPAPFPANLILRLRRHEPLRPGKPTVVLCVKWDPHSGGEKTAPGGDAVMMEELEFPVNDGAIWNPTGEAILGVPILKTRRYFEKLIPGYLVELDIFSGALQGLVVAEIEFPSLEAARTFRAPHCLAGGVDVTGDRRYGNRVLALQGLPSA